MITSLLLSVVLTSVFIGMFVIISKLNQHIPIPSVSENRGRLGYDPRKLYMMTSESQRKFLEKLYNRMCPKGYTLAFKGFNEDLTCRDFKYHEGEHYKIQGKPICCQYGFHACLLLKDCFTYYRPSYSVYHVVFVKDYVTNEFSYDSKVCAKEIIIGPRIYLK